MEKRIIKFRGKDIKGNWHYGLLTHDKTPNVKSDYEWFISNSKGKPYAYGVIESTIDQFTGLYDKNGVEIYEGDILQYDYEIRIKGIVKWIDDEALFSIHYESGKYGLFAGEDMSLFEIIGNVHEEAKK